MEDDDGTTDNEGCLSLEGTRKTTRYKDIEVKYQDPTFKWQRLKFSGPIAQAIQLILINTHADPDHISGNAAFDEVYMSPDEEENYRGFGGSGRIIPIHEGDVIDLGDRPLRIIDIPGHTPGSIAIIDEKNRVLVSGDSVEDGNVFMFGERRDIDKYIPSMEHLLEYTDAFDEIYPMHGSFPVKNDLIGKLIEVAKLIKSGAVEGKKVDVFGTPAMFYKFPYAGFLCDPQ